jgi:hypothetical protein
MVERQTGMWPDVHLMILLFLRYCRNVNSLSAGDRLGVCRTENGNLHFFVNGKHEGVAATGVPQGA